MLAAAANRRLLSAALSARYEVVEDLSASDVDLIIVDGLSLHRFWNELRAARAAHEPALLPVLMLSDRRDIGLITRDAWRVADDVLFRPVEQLELAARVETMLRARRLSLRLQRMSELYEHERRIARRLQDAALPRTLPQVPGLTFDAYYHAGSDQAQIGGDWYDAARLADGRIVLTVGDVLGSGLDAAVTMANVRQILRGVAHVHPDPATMLDAADRTLQGDPAEPMVTAFVGVLDPVTSLLTYASAGHPRPLIRHRDGALQELCAVGLPLGVPGRVPRTTEYVAMPPDGLLVLYTDGLTESTRDLVDGEERLRLALRDDAIVAAPQLARRLLNEVAVGGSPDDVAVFTVFRHDPEPSLSQIHRWSFFSDDAAGARAVQHQVAEMLARHGMNDDAIGAAELLFAELLGNVVRYAGGLTEIALDFGGMAPVLHVLDRGRGFRHLPKLPADVLAESGRGLYIVSSLAEEFTVTRRPDGGSHARAVLALNAGDHVPSAFAFPDLDTIDLTV
ncbi:MAG TPA: SpoIIE family protein phosphatase [Candidatus Elarobacter sp.]